MAKQTQTQRINDLEKKIEHLQLLNGLDSFSVPRGVATSNTDLLYQREDRESYYAQQQEMYRDTFVRELVKVIIVRAIGTTHDNIKPFQIAIDNEAKLNDNYKKQILKECKYLEKLIDKNLLDIVMDSQFFGDGYSRVVFEKGKGVTKLLRNISTKPFNITPIVTNKGNIVAYEVGNFFDRVKKNDLYQASKGRFYVNPYVVARMNSEGNGLNSITPEQINSINNLNLFVEDETPYEDSTNGGVMEGTYDDYVNFKWALSSLINTRIGASVVERFIIHSLNSVSDNERKELKTALENQIKTTLSSIKDRVDNKSADILIANHIIPTTQDGTNSISIQESNTNNPSLQSVEDIMIHIRKFLGAIGFNIEMTSFAGMSIGGHERDGVVQNSLQMDAQGTQIRKAIRDYVLQIIKTHFLSKFGTEIDLEIFDIRFQSVLNQAKLTAEQQRLEAITNLQQVLAIIEQIKPLGIPDNEQGRITVRAILEDIIATTTENKEVVIDSLVEAVFTKPPQDEMEM